MANEEVEDALQALTKEEIGELVELIDPDVSSYYYDSIWMYIENININVEVLVLEGLWYGGANRTTVRPLDSIVSRIVFTTSFLLKLAIY